MNTILDDQIGLRVLRYIKQETAHLGGVSTKQIAKAFGVELTIDHAMLFCEKLREEGHIEGFKRELEGKTIYLWKPTS